MNIMILDDLKFQINNFNNTNKDYDVDVYIQDESENDQYTIEVYEINEDKKDMITLFYCDSSGNFKADEITTKDDLMSYIYNILFVTPHHGIIRGF